MEKIFTNTKNSKGNESNKFIYQFIDKLNLKIPLNKNIGLVNSSIYYTWTNIKSAYNNNIWNYEFDLPDNSYWISDIQGHFEFVIKKHENLTENSPIQIYPNKIKNRIIFKIKTGYKLE